MEKLKTFSLAFILVGAALLFLGLAVKLLHYPEDIAKGLISGPILIGIGIVLLLLMLENKETTE
ncbi:MAG: hypothetical protein CL843_14065 [Crocinitomicaceae bacterium]|nr:hypothetical protein [Crocinitomicaceae bacterium]|tara:strand:- start:224 stop:415 length:192 start_codon:yes stop_codon:yes gene_type:complete